MPERRIRIVIPNHNGGRWLGPCLESLLPTLPPETRIIVVDNGSDDVRGLAGVAGVPGVETLAIERNLGFALGVNLGMRRALADDATDIILLNNDTRFPDSAWLARMIDGLEDEPAIGVAGPIQNDFAGQISPRSKTILERAGRTVTASAPKGNGWPNGSGATTTHPTLPLNGGGLSDRPSASASTSTTVAPLSSTLASSAGERWIDTDWVEGSCLWVRREVLERIGPIDPLFSPAYWEEADFCRRARRAGFRVSVDTASLIDHHGAGSAGPGTSGPWRVASERNYLLYRLTEPDLTPAGALAALWGVGLRHGLKRMLQRKLSPIAWVQALAGAISRMPQARRKRFRDRFGIPCPWLPPTESDDPDLICYEAWLRWIDGDIEPVSDRADRSDESGDRSEFRRAA